PCPVLVIHGDRDWIVPHTQGAALAEVSGGRLLTMKGSGHIPLARDPVKFNLLLRDFVEPAPSPATWVRGRSRKKRALYISSPIGLGHAQRDVAIADELRRLHPDLEIDWLAQHPVTAGLTDFVGWLPMPDGGDKEAALTADYNAEMIEHIDRYPRVRDRAIFVGDPDDIVPERFGADLPVIREWTEQHFDFAGYVTGFDPA